MVLIFNVKNYDLRPFRKLFEKELESLPYLSEA